MRLCVFMWCVVSAVASAQDDVRRRAQEELDRQLNEMVKTAPAKLTIDFTPVDDPNYQLQEAVFSLDGVPLKTPPISQIKDDKKQVYSREVEPGKHKVSVRVVYKNGASVIASDEGGFGWTVVGDNTFEIQSGIEVKIDAVAKYLGKARPVKERIALSLPAKPTMIAALDDGRMPERPAPPKIAVAVVDAGVPPVVAKTPAELKKEKAEEAKRLAEEKARAKAEALAEARAAAQAKRDGLKASAGTGQQAKSGATTPAAPGPTPAATEAAGSASANTMNEPVDAGMVAAQEEPVDAGGTPPVVAVAAPVATPQPPPVQAQTGSDFPTTGVAVCGGLGLLLLLIFAFTRQKKK
jgi:OmpA-OmpF porin, OOP family